MPKGYLMLVFHAHLPFVRNPELNYSLEENWLFEALTETYIPLIMVFERLLAEEIDFRLTLGLTPTLMHMLEDRFLQKRYQNYLSSRLELAEKEQIRTWAEPDFHALVRWYRTRLQAIEQVNYAYRGRILDAFRKFHALGKIEILTCAATHGFLPLLQGQPKAVKAQIDAGVKAYRSFMGRDPRGIWLPECAYYPGLEKYLRAANLRYSFLDTAGITKAHPKPPHGVLTPLMTDAQVAFFGRDAETSRQVWCAQTGYPGDPVYRDFYRDLGFDLDMDYIRPYIDPAGIRIFTGFKYYRVTGNTVHKQVYDPIAAQRQAKFHADHFAASLKAQIRQHQDVGRPPLVVSAYDAELLGHWWFEGPAWVEYLLRNLAQQEEVQLITGPEYLALHPENHIGQPAVSSWGDQGYYTTWLNPTNDWIYPHLYAAGKQMEALVNSYPTANPLERRILNQALRELLLAQSSDWAFIMNNQTAVQYAKNRTKEHMYNFQQLYKMLRPVLSQKELSPQFKTFLQGCEVKNNLFPDLDYQTFK